MAGAGLMLLDTCAFLWLAQGDQLPPIHNDPCDRMIIASALKHRLSVVTLDPVFGSYDIETRC